MTGRRFIELPMDCPPARAVLAHTLRNLHRAGHDTIRQTACKARVSISTASRVFSGSTRASGDMYQAVTQACGGDWLAVRPLWVAAMLEAERPKTVTTHVMGRLEAAEGAIADMALQLEGVDKRLRKLEQS